MSFYGSGLFVLSSSPAGGQLSPTVWTLVVIGSATTVIVDRKVKRSFFWFCLFWKFLQQGGCGILGRCEGVPSQHGQRESRSSWSWGRLPSSQILSKIQECGGFQNCTVHISAWQSNLGHKVVFFQVPGFTLPFNIVGWIVWAVLLRFRKLFVD